MDRFEMLAQAFDLLIKGNRQVREDFESSRATYSSLAFARDMQLVSLNIGRLTGKTELIRRRAAVDDIVLSLAPRTFGQTLAEVQDAKVLLVRQPSIHRYSRIWIDDASYMHDRVKITEIIHVYLKDHEQTFIALG